MTKIDIDVDSVTTALAKGNFEIEDNPYSALKSISSYVNSVYNALGKIEESWESVASKVGLYVEDFRGILLPELEMPSTDYLDSGELRDNSGNLYGGYYSGSSGGGSSKPEEKIAIISLDSTDAKINVLNSPTDTDNVVSTLSRGDKVKIIEDSENSEWIKVELVNGKVGYIQKSYANVVPSTSRIANVNISVSMGSLDVRNLPSSSDNSLVVNHLMNDEVVEVIGQSEVNGWTKIKFNGIERYVQSQYLDIQEELWEDR